MPKDAKDPKNKPDGVRQPQRKDSLSSVLSWAALQGKITTTPKASSTSSSTPSPQSTPGNGTRPRRHSHSATTDTKTKARRGSTTIRRLSFSITTTIQEGASSTKTRRAKASMTPDSKASPGTSKSAKSGSSEKVNRAGADTTDGKTTIPPRPQSALDKPRPSSAPIPMPRSILRVSSPDGPRRPRHFVNPETGEPTSPGLPPSSPDTPPGSPPQDSPPDSPIHRPMSPGATVRFAKATIHRVEVGPGRRFLPVKRKSKSTLTYISPLDPGTQKSAPKTMLQSPTKLRRHQENQAAMGRYWLRTEEEEAQWRAEAERRAREEAERYRNEPASPPPQPADVLKVDGGDGDGVQSASAIDKLPMLDSGSGHALDKVEEVVESESEDEEAGAKCNVGENGTSSHAAEGRSGEVGAEVVEVGGKVKKQAVQVPVEESEVNTTALTLNPSITAPQETAAKPAVAATATLPQRPEDPKLAESRSFFEHLALKQAAEERAKRAPSPTTSKAEARNTTIKQASSSCSSNSSLSKDKTSASSSGRSSSTSTTSSTSSTSSAEQITKTRSSSSSTKEKEKEKDKDKEKDKEKGKARTTSISTVRPNMSLRASSSSSFGTGGGSSSRADRTSTSTTSSRGGGGSSNHLHLSGRRGRRYWEEYKLGVVA